MKSDVEVFWIARYDYESDWYVPPHSHDFFQLICVLEGTGSAAVGSRTYALAEGHLLLLHPNIEHAIAADRGASLRTLDTKFAVHHATMRSDLTSLDQLAMDENHRVRQLLEKMRVEGMRRQAWYRESCNALLTQCLIALFRYRLVDEAAQPPETEVLEDDPAIHRARRFIEEHFAESLRVRDVAAHVGYSAEYLSKRFVQATGVSLHAYLMRHRIAKAKELLTYGAASIKEVTSLTGFKSIHHFTRTFGEIAGVPPGRWRDRERSGVWKDVVIAPGFVNRNLTVRADGSNSRPTKTDRS